MENKYWEKYEAGVRYNGSFKKNKDFYEAVKVWYDFYQGDQWQGLEGDDKLPHPTFNFTKRIIDFQTASLTTNNISINVEPLEYMGQYGEELNVSDFINAEIKNILEKTNFDIRKKQLLTDGAVTGDMCVHVLFDPNSKPYRGQFPEVKGEIDIELIDATNVLFGNANVSDPQKQPYIVIVGRDTVKNLQKEAKNKHIQSDTDTNHQSSDYTEVEIDGDEEGKALYIYVYEKKDDKILVTKCTKDCVIYEKVDTNLTRYPVAFANWYRQKNTYHGRGMVEGICPNQIAINKMFAMIIYHQMTTAFPTPVFDGDVLSEWTTQLGRAMKLKGVAAKGRTIKDVAGYLEPANMSEYIIKVIDLAFSYTKECLGVSDAALGLVNPENTSAIIAVQKSTAVPLANIKDNLYSLIEQLTLILIDTISAKYGTRPVLLTNDKGERQIISYDFSQLSGMDLKVSVDVGETSYYSEIAMITTLDNLLSQGLIEFTDYLERLPNDMFPKKAEYLAKLKQKAETEKQGAYEQMAQFLEVLPPEQSQQLQEILQGWDVVSSDNARRKGQAQIMPTEEAMV